MFEGISLCTIQYADTHIADSLTGVHVGNNLLYEDSSMSEGKIYLENCSYLLDGVSRVCPQYPVSAFARENLFYIQSFSLWQAGSAYYTKRKNLESFLLVYTYSGNGRLDYGNKSFPLEKGEAFLINCREAHYYRAEQSGWEHCDLHFYGKLGEYLYRDFIKDNNCVFHPEPASDFQKKLEHLLKTYVSVSPYREYQVSSLLNELFVYILTETRTFAHDQQNTPDQLKFLIHYVNSNYSHDLSLEYLSDFFGFSKYHLCRIFKKYTGFTLNDYITQLRLERAKELLTTTALPANKIGTIVGINDENYFYRLFRKHIGVSPQKYRKNKRSIPQVTS